MLPGFRGLLMTAVLRGSRCQASLLSVRDNRMPCRDTPLGCGFGGRVVRPHGEMTRDINKLPTVNSSRGASNFVSKSGKLPGHLQKRSVQGSEWSRSDVHNRTNNASAAVRSQHGISSCAAMQQTPTNFEGK